LNDHAQDENTSGDEDTIFSRCRLGHEAREHGANPRSKFEDGCQPSLARLILRSGAIVISHMFLEGWHGKNPREDSLIVTYTTSAFCRTSIITIENKVRTIKQSSNASKHGNTEDSEILHQGCRPTFAHQSLATLKGRIVDARSCISCDHFDVYEFLAQKAISSRKVLRRKWEKEILHKVDITVYKSLTKDLHRSAESCGYDSFG
jgi:hypothetical protein